jgi:hypothetical protein
VISFGLMSVRFNFRSRQLLSGTLPWVQAFNAG